MNSIEAKKGFLSFSFLCFASFSIYFFSKKIVELKFSKTAEDVTISVIDEASVTQTTTTTAEITWATKESVLGSIVYGTDQLACTEQETGSCLTASEEVATTNHKISLVNLIPSTTYYHYLDNNTKKIESFTTKPQEPLAPVVPEPVVNKIEGDTNGDGQLNSLDFFVE